MLPMLKAMDEAGVILWQAFIDGITDYTVVIRFLPVVKFTLNCAGLKGSHLDPLMDWKDRFCFWLLNWVLYSLGSYRIGKEVTHRAVHLCLSFGSRKYLAESGSKRQG